MKRKDKERMIDALEDRKFKVGMKVKVRDYTIKNGLLKDKCKSLLGGEGIVIKDEGVTTDESAIEVKWGEYHGVWVMPKDSLEIIK